MNTDVSITIDATLIGPKDTDSSILVNKFFFMVG
jgi:hypothetical protein